VLTVKHDRALALVDGAAMGGRTYLLVNASLRLAHAGGWIAFLPALGTSLLVAALVIREVNRHDQSEQLQTWRTLDEAPATDSASRAH
jgi:hypothetical protein